MADAPPDKAVALLRLATTATYVDPAVASAALARADALFAGAQVDREVSAEFERRKGLVLLNTGDFAGARAKSGGAVKLLGGLTEMTELAEVSARSDTAIAALLLGDDDTARRYMAYTGAGRLPDGTFDPAVQMKAPDCGGEGGLKPNDMAIIEFSIGDDGTVKMSAPVYAAGGGSVALAFARAALGWSWTPDQVKKLPTFFRYNIRLEMRCSTAFERPSIRDILGSALEAWMSGKHIAVPPVEGSDALALPRQRAALAAVSAKDGAQALSLLPIYYRLLNNSVLPREQKNAMATNALAIADANGVPALPRLAIDMVVRDTARAEWRGGVYVGEVTELLLQPLYAADPEARSAIRLLVADAELHSSRSRARELFRQVADDPALVKNDPMRVGALVRIASMEQQDGDAAAARAALDQSGLAANQCSIVDSPPRMLRAGGSFPREAQQWGFEGWTQTQFDVSADGRVINARAILSYPPFVFTKAGTETMAGARYTKSYRPDGGLGCGASAERVRFKIAH